MYKLFKDPYVDSMIDLFFETPSFYRGVVKRTNITDAEDGYHIQLAVPGLSKEDIKVQVKNDILSISYEKEHENEKEFLFTNSFKKEYVLPDDSDDKNISGKLEKGILELIIPKSKKKVNERTIEIK